MPPKKVKVPPRDRLVVAARKPQTDSGEHLQAAVDRLEKQLGEARSLSMSVSPGHARMMHESLIRQSSASVRRAQQSEEKRLKATERAASRRAVFERNMERQRADHEIAIENAVAREEERRLAMARKVEGVETRRDLWAERNQRQAGRAVDAQVNHASLTAGTLTEG